MGPSLSLAAYRAYVKRNPAPKYEPVCLRPKGELIWAHATNSARLVALTDLCGRLAAQRNGLQVLITYDSERVSENTARKAAESFDLSNIEPVPSDHPASVDKFLAHWAPDACVWTGGFLRPNLILASAERAMPMFLIDASENGFDSRKERWFPEVSRRLLSEFSGVMAQSDAARRRILKLGLEPDDVLLSSQLQPGGQVLPCDLDELNEMTNQLAARPVWLAAEVQADEIDLVLMAHRQTARLAHRLLLILVPASESPDLAARVAAQGFRVADWSQGTMPDEITQVLVVDSPNELGLWYRLAPLAFVGSSLVSGHRGKDPFSAAALGSAVLYGPNVSDHIDAYTRLSTAGAARIVRDADGLGTAVLRLIAPDFAASMAHAGWEVVSSGAELTDHVIELVQNALDMETAT